MFFLPLGQDGILLKTDGKNLPENARAQVNVNRAKINKQQLRLLKENARAQMKNRN